MRTLKITSLLMALAWCLNATPAEFFLGADISGTSELEKRGITLYNSRGEPRDNISLMREIGLNAARFRVWVDPKDGLCNKHDVLKMALRAKQAGMQIMIDFHYSDWWADPGKQYIPNAWQGMNLEQMTKALAEHTRSTLALLRDNGIDVRWVQVGNETTNGFLWPIAKTPDGMREYAILTQAGYEAAKEVFPNTTCIVHLDAGCDIKRYRAIFDGLRAHGTQFDMIGMSVYPYWDLDAGLESDEQGTLRDVVKNIKELNRLYGCDVMIVETGYEVRRPQQGKRFLLNLIEAAINETEGHCHGVFYWAPEAEGHYPLGAFHNHRPTAIMEAFTIMARKLN